MTITQQIVRNNSILKNFSSNNSLSILVAIGLSNKEQGSTLYANQMLAIALKKLVSTKRTWGMELLKIVFPLVCIILIFNIDFSNLTDMTFKQRSFDLNQYNNPITLVQTDDNLQEPYIDMFNKMKQKIEVTDDMSDRLLKLVRCTH